MQKYKRYRHQDFYNTAQNKDGEIIIIPKEDFIVDTTLIRAGEELEEGIFYGGIDWHLYKNRDLAFEVDEQYEFIRPLRLVGFEQDPKNTEDENTEKMLKDIFDNTTMFNRLKLLEKRVNDLCNCVGLLLLAVVLLHLFLVLHPFISLL
jgi:hypothetical protein